MKPNFALNLTHESIGLLHRTARGWMEIGAAALDDPDMGEALNYLRRSALGLAPHGVATKLVIPSSQILYFEADAPGPDNAYRRAQIRRALEGRTPYDVDDLVFDWSGDGPMVQVAVVARETLAEAEQFAAQYKLNPVSFVAIPENGEFAGEPWFGPTALAATLLPAGEKVERDSEAVSIVTRDPHRHDPKPAPVVEAAVADAEAPTPEWVAPEPALAEPLAPVAVMDEPVDDLPDDLEMAGDALRDQVADDVPVAPTVATPPIAALTVATPPVSKTEFPAPPALSVTATEIPTEDAPLPNTAPAFASRRAPEGNAPMVGPAGVSAAGVGPAGDAPMSEKPAPRLSAAAMVAAAKAELTANGGKPAAAPMTARKAAPAQVAKKAKGLAGLVTAQSIPGLGPRKAKPPATSTVVAPPPAPSAPPAAPSAAKTKPAFARAAPVRGKPKYLGLILTAILLVFLALVAAWSTFYIASKRAADDTAVASAPDTVAAPEAATAPAATALPAPDVTAPAAIGLDDEALADMQGAAVTAPAAVDTATADPASTPVVSTSGTNTLTTATDLQDEIMLATPDAPPAAVDVSALAEPVVNADALPAAQVPPPPFGTQYQFGPDGLIVPTAEGIVTPDGVRLILGRPSTVPPPRPAALVPPTPDAALTTPPDALATDTAQPAPSDPALAGFRPKPRPATLVPPTADVATEDDASLTPVPGGLGASRRPLSRPATVAALAEAARKATEAASLSASAAVDATKPEEDATLAAAALAPVSRLAVAVSRRPEARPRNFSKAVEAAVAAAVRPPEPEADPAPEPAPEPEPAAKPKAEPEADDEPEVATAAPKIPTKASVAKTATFVNAINLSKINLIGVYGTSSKRYALVRLSTGQYKKVKVGDRVDGGTVAAITDKELRYQKGGKMVALTMPKG